MLKKQQKGTHLIMKVTQIFAGRSDIRFLVETDAHSLKIVERASIVGPTRGRIIEEILCEVRSGVASIARFSGKHDRLFSRFELYAGDEKLQGVCYITDFDADVPENRNVYPQPDTIKAMGCTAPEEIRRLNVKQNLTNINLQAIMTTDPKVDDIAFEHDGKTYYFIRSVIESYDKFMQDAAAMGEIVTIILLNSPRGFGSTRDKRLLDIALHPDYDS